MTVGEGVSSATVAGSGAGASGGRPVTTGGEVGSATVLTVGGLGVVLLVLVGVLVVAATVRDVHRARASADLAALAAVAPTATGGGVDCATGASVAAANGGVLSACAVQSDGTAVLTVTVRRDWPPGWGWFPALVSARAHAGLVDAAPP